jgi:hypothetical protein
MQVHLIKKYVRLFTTHKHRRIPNVSNHNSNTTSVYPRGFPRVLPGRSNRVLRRRKNRHRLSNRLLFVRERVSRAGLRWRVLSQVRLTFLPLTKVNITRRIQWLHMSSVSFVLNDSHVDNNT